jgi:hypothetical protein
MTHVFILPCYFQRTNPVIINAVKSIRKFHSDSPIIVVDSGSDDKSYFKDIEPYSVIIEDINNKHYDTGAFWYVYTKYPQFDFFYCLHDSIEVYDNLLDLLNNEITSIRYFNSANIIGNRRLVVNKIDFLKKYFFSKITQNHWNYDICGFDTPEQQEWVKKEIQKTSYWIPDFFPALFGPMMCVKKSILDKFYAHGLSSILPKNKNQQMAMERIFGIAFLLEGYNIKANSLQGDYYSAKLDSSRLDKKILQRQ